MTTKSRLWRSLGWSLAAAGLTLSAPALAQDDDTAAERDDGRVEEIVVTGSKIRRDEFSSISPVQVIGGQDSVRIGIVDPTQMIAESPFVTGTQLDGSTNSSSATGAVEGVPANGPGAATIALRGLGAERTLMLVNGRRLSPSGVRGAPVAPDLNLIPAAMIDRIEILTDGASSIYGADAVAGVANIILRQDFEGIELNAFGTSTDQSGGEETLISMMGGAANDRSSFMLAAEYFNRETIFARDRTDWNECAKSIEVAPDGTQYSICMDRRPDNAAVVTEGADNFDGPFFIFYAPGFTDPTGVLPPGWADDDDANLFLGRTGIGVDNPGVLTGLASETPYNLQQEVLDTQLQGNVERINIYGTGKYELTPNHTVYMEGSYTQRQNFEHFTNEQVFPAIPRQIRQEACAQVEADGTCLEANQFIVSNPDGTPVLVDNPLNPFDTGFERAVPVYTLAGLQQTRDTDLDNVRFVAGIEGDLGGGGWFSDRGWSYDAFFSYEESSGTSTAPGIFENNVLMSIDTLRINWDGNLECGVPRQAGGFGFTSPQACVPVNWFSPTLYDVNGSGNKRFATEAEEDFLFGNVINSTEIKQEQYSALVTGEIFDMPAGPAAMAFGLEYRVNSIDSNNDIIRANGLSASESTDIEGDTVGETWIADAYAEFEVPLHETFLLNLSGRYTEEKNFGNETTWSAKAQWRPVDAFSVRATAGTTFRAPNLREQFLAGQAGTLNNTFDPCVVPNEAVQGGVYDPSLDPRSQRVIDNCIADGTDPTQLGIAAGVLIPTNTGGSDDIKAETSDSFTVGFVYSQTFTDAFDLDFGVTYFDYDVEDTVEELQSSEILRRCYNDEDNLASPFCDRISRRGVVPSNNTVSRVDASFVNLGLVTSKGYDVNVRYVDDFQVGESFWDLRVTMTATNYDELKEQVDPESPINDRVGEAGFPEWSWINRIDLSTGNWGVAWRTRYVSDFRKDSEDVTASSNLSRRDACRVTGGPTDCVKKAFGPSELYHDLSATYERDDWSVTLGIKNIFDNSPPLVNQDTDEAPSRLNYVVQSTYDLFGRRAFLNLRKNF